MDSYTSSPRTFSLPPVEALIRACVMHERAYAHARPQLQSVADVLLSHPIKGFPQPARPDPHPRFARSLSLESPGPMSDGKYDFGKERFPCTECSASFSRKNSLKRHLYTHNRVRPYNCNFCRRAFYRADIYHRHLKSKKCLQARS